MTTVQTTNAKHNILLLWCHPSIQKMQQSNLSWNGDVFSHNIHRSLSDRSASSSSMMKLSDIFLFLMRFSVAQTASLYVITHSFTLKTQFLTIITIQTGVRLPLMFVILTVGVAAWSYLFYVFAYIDIILHISNATYAALNCRKWEVWKVKIGKLNYCCFAATALTSTGCCSSHSTSTPRVPAAEPISKMLWVANGWIFQFWVCYPFKHSPLFYFKNRLWIMRVYLCWLFLAYLAYNRKPDIMYVGEVLCNTTCVYMYTCMMWG